MATVAVTDATFDSEVVNFSVSGWSAVKSMTSPKVRRRSSPLSP